MWTYPNSFVQGDPGTLITTQCISYSMYCYKNFPLCAFLTEYVPKLAQCAYAHALKCNLRKREEETIIYIVLKYKQ